MGKSKVDRKTAAQEFEQWLDYNKIRAKKRLENENSSDLVVELIQDGSVIVDLEKKSIKYTLAHPITDKSGAAIYQDIEIKSRVTLAQFSQELSQISVKLDDGISRVTAMVAASSGLNVNLLTGLDMADFETLQAIVIFLL